MERRVLLAIALSFIVLFGYQALFVPAPPPQTAGNTVPQAVLPGAVPGVATPGNVTASAAPPVLPPVATLVGDVDEREVVVETPKVRAVFVNRGARVRHWILKDFKDDHGQPLDLVPKSIPAGLPRPFSLRAEDPAITVRLNESLYKVVDAGPVVDAESQTTTLTFELETVDGLKATKRFTFEAAPYIVLFAATVQKDGKAINPLVDWGPGLGDDIAHTTAGSFLSPNYTYKAQAIFHTDGAVERVAATSLGAGLGRDGQFRWAGVDDHYFISAVLQPAAPTHLEYQYVTIPDVSVTPPAAGDYVAYAVRLPSSPENLRFYVGPKLLDVMRGIDPEFTRAIYFGMFAWLAAPLLDGLKWVHRYVGEWGWSIIVLTILINLAMFPLRHKSVVSMRRMQELQPQMKAIQDRYARYKITDPERQKMNSEVMDLYKSKGVNPASGCVPTLLTMPFLFAFYAMLGQAIEIRGEGFLGWIPDLARADPYYIMPLVMGLSMFWQMRIQPTTADPTQQKVMMFMPIMISVTMLFAPSGLVIYWLVSNLWNIGQQYFTNYLIGPAKAATGAGSKVVKAPKDIVVPKTPDDRFR